jgi:hypothetical protein
MPEITDRDIWFAIIGAAAAYISVCVLIWPIASCIARYSLKRGPRLVKIEDSQTHDRARKERA